MRLLFRTLSFRFQSPITACHTLYHCQRNASSFLNTYHFSLPMQSLKASDDLQIMGLLAESNNTYYHLHFHKELDLCLLLR